MPICRICSASTTLVESHIIPRAFHLPLRKDDSGNVIDVYTFEKQESSYTTKRLPGGQYERMLCVDCEKKFDKVDNYGVQVFLKDFPAKWSKGKESGVDYYELLNCNVLMIKKFLLSMLYRASLSKLRFFENVYLGPYEHKLLKFIQDEHVSVDEYPMFMFHVNNPIGIVIHAPVKQKIDGVIWYKFYFYNYGFMVKVGQLEVQCPYHTYLIGSANDRIFVFEKNYFKMPEMRVALKAVKNVDNRYRR